MSSKRKTIDDTILLEAVKRVKISNESKRSVAKNLNIPRTTLLRHLDSIDNLIPDVSKAKDDQLLMVLKQSKTIGPTPIFTQYEESALMDYILKCASLYNGLSITEIKHLAFEFAVKVGAPYPPQWNENKMAGRKWFDSFMKRHPNLSIRTPQNISLNDAMTEMPTTSTAAIFELSTSSAGLVSILRKRAEKRANSLSKLPQKKVVQKKKEFTEIKAKKPAAKNKYDISSFYLSDVDLCIICKCDMPKKLNKKNSINCNVCDRSVHRKCAKLIYGIFICENCEADDNVVVIKEEEI